MTEIIITSTIQNADARLNADDVEGITALVEQGNVLRKTETTDEIGQPSSGARVVEFTDGQIVRYALHWFDAANTEIVTYDDRGGAEAAYEAHVRELADTGWVWDRSDVDGILDYDAWIAALDAETAGRASAAEALSFACAAGVFGGLGLDTESEHWDDERLIIAAENGWIATWNDRDGWV